MLQKTSQLYRRSRLLRSGSWYLFSTFVERGLAFLGVLIFTRLLTTEEYGTIAIFLSWVSIFAATITLNSTASIQLARYDYEDDAYRSFVTSSTTLGMLTGSVALLIILGMPVSLTDQIFRLDKIYLILAVLAVILESPWKAALFVWRVEYQYKRYALTSILIALSKVVLPLLLIITPAFFPERNQDGRIYGILLVSLITGIYFTRWMLIHSRTLVNRQMWHYALSYGMPLIPHALTGFILSHFDRILIDRYVGREETGLYTFAYQLGEIVFMVWYASNTAWLPWFYEQMKKENYELIRKRATQYLVAFTTIIGLVILSAPLLVWLFAPSGYETAGVIVPIVMSGLFFNLPYSLYTNIQFYQKRTAYVSLGTALAAGVNLLLNLWWLPEIGYIGAAWSTLVAYILLYVFHAAIVKYGFQSSVKFNEPLIVLTGIIMILISIVVYIAMAT